MNDIIEEAANLYKNSNKRVKFDMNLMTQAIEGGMEIGLIFQSNNEKYKMPIWKTRIVQPVAMGYNKKGDLVIRGIHVEGQSEKKAIETGIRSAQANGEWRLFKASNIKSMFFTGRLFTSISLPGYNPNDSAMGSIIISFNPDVAKKYQEKLAVNKDSINKAPKTSPEIKPEPNLAPKPEVPNKVIPKKAPVKSEPSPKVNPKPVTKKSPKVNISPEDAKAIQQKIDKLNKLL